GRDADYVIPPSTLLIEGPAAIVDRVVERHGSRRVAEALLDFLRSPRGQAILADYGFRPLAELAKQPVERPLVPQAVPPLPPHLFTMADLGGWKRVNKEVYGAGGVWDALFLRQEPERVRAGGRGPKP